MIELNEHQVELISAYIKQHGVAQDELHDDLLDHICTSIENAMANGKSFEEAFADTIKLFGPGGLKQVQQQTFELLTEMNETMKKVTFTFGLTAAFLLLAGTIFKLLHWPGAGIMIVLGTASLVLVYLPLVLTHKLKESPRNEALMHIAGWGGLTLTSLGVLFKIMHWPGAAFILMSGIAVLAAGYVPIYFYKKYKVSANKPVTLSASLVAITCLILVFALTNTRPSQYFDEGMTLINASLDESGQRLDGVNQFYLSLDGNAQASHLRQTTDEMYAYLERVKLGLIAECEGISMDEAATRDLSQMRTKYSFDIPTHLMWGPNEESELHINSMISKIRQFEEEVVSIYDEPFQHQMREAFPIQIDKNYDMPGGKEGWGKHYFYHRPLAAVLSQLSKLQLDVRMAESQALMYLLSQPAASNPPS